MTWRDRLLGRDTPNLHMVRAMATVLWWFGWFIFGFGVIWFFVTLPNTADSLRRMDARPIEMARGYGDLFFKMTWLLLGWAVLTAMLAVHDFLVEDASEYETGGEGSASEGI